MVTYYVVLGFQLGRNGVLIADQPREVPNKGQCLSLARRAAAERAGVVAFSRSGDPNLGNWDDAVIIWRDGIVPEEIFQTIG